jgi:hypothetical protein
MKYPSRLLVRASLAAGFLLAMWPRPAAAYIDFPPPTLGALCGTSHHIYVLKVDKVSAEDGVILFKCVEQLKGKPDATAAKHVIGPKAEGAKIVLDWAAEGKTAVLFTITAGAPGGTGLGVGHAYIDNYWYSLSYDREAKCWRALRGAPALLTRYCGSPDKLRDAVADVLADKEVVVPCMVNDKKEDVEQRRAKVQRLKASLKLKDFDAKRDFVGWDEEEK